MHFKANGFKNLMFYQSKFKSEFELKCVKNEMKPLKSKQSGLTNDEVHMHENRVNDCSSDRLVASNIVSDLKVCLFDIFN